MERVAPTGCEAKREPAGQGDSALNLHATTFLTLHATTFLTLYAPMQQHTQLARTHARAHTLGQAHEPGAAFHPSYAAALAWASRSPTPHPPHFPALPPQRCAPHPRADCANSTPTSRAPQRDPAFGGKVASVGPHVTRLRGRGSWVGWVGEVGSEACSLESPCGEGEESQRRRGDVSERASEPGLGFRV